MSDFKKIYDDVYGLAARDTANSFEHMSKLTEEVGEFAQVVNMLHGRKGKISDFDKNDLKINLIEEAIDSIQVIFSILAKNGVTDIEELEEIFDKKLKKYASFIKNEL